MHPHLCSAASLPKSFQTARLPYHRQDRLPSTSAFFLHQGSNTVKSRRTRRNPGTVAFLVMQFPSDLIVFPACGFIPEKDVPYCSFQCFLLLCHIAFPKSRSWYAMAQHIHCPRVLIGPAPKCSSPAFWQFVYPHYNAITLVTPFSTLSSFDFHIGAFTLQD